MGHIDLELVKTAVSGALKYEMLVPYGLFKELYKRYIDFNKLSLFIVLSFEGLVFLWKIRDTGYATFYIDHNKT